MKDPEAVEFGLDTFGDVTVGEDGTALPYAQVIRNVVEQAVLADRLGVDAFGVGEHHRDDYAISSPEIVLAAIAAKTERIKLGTAVTVLSSDDPVRVYERFATLDAISGGRSEIILGRGSFTESFPLFGFDLADYDRLFSEKLDLMSHLLTEGPITWSGSVRPPLADQQVYPKTESGRIRASIGVGGSPESVVRTAQYGLPLVLAIIGGEPARFAPYVDLYHRALKELEQPEQPVAVHCPGFVAETDDEAIDVLWPHARRMLDRLGRERGWPRTTKDRFVADVTEGAWHVGSPETVAQKIAATVRALGIQRFDLKYSHGTLPHDRLMTCVELYGSQVIPRVRELLAD
ncbi:putative luciferase-like monooxygenase [Actinoplanes missouriensis 431]|uniref:Putative luciferase-like monooxygenase n=1 Tax=Actinoplanes missouriensis (strain ATCC 14538 / DSM 43046 / CBS 188.64 / JCM 3121 / NBRC 102363 / NCIMB 12654 / NRRL B-3342 / UNCC 431) TaxID=512565 RepID=I0HBE2_ACTM4|nr:LLM class flavin-dependent oxidoreductase [Actinoplanes missouriensis]BAL90329.1 putative luciferase-like monooxygenase [Actinoplanes missouriensis 431]